MIAHITPFCTGNIGKGINDMISLLPDDAWICLRDQDTLLFDGSGELKSGFWIAGILVFAGAGTESNRYPNSLSF